MLGQIRVRHSEDRAELQVNDIWYTIQGEGPYVGYPALFIRLTGCNLRCHFCDTEWDDDNDSYCTIDNIMDRVYDNMGNHPFNLVVITGGEPVRQNLSQLIHHLDRCFPIIQMETAGTLWQPCLTLTKIVVCPKTPKIHPFIYDHAAAFKYVIQA